MERLAKRVLLVGWDAADWQIIHPLIENGKMPVLKKLIEVGVSGRIATLQPIISPILWTSIATGKRADKHDILGFIEPSPDGNGARLVSSTSRKAKAIWNILSQLGLRSGVVNWFASHPAEPIVGTIFSNRFASVLGAKAEILPLDRRAIHPPELLEMADSFRIHPHTLSAEQMLPFFPGEKPTDPDDFRPGMLGKILAECATVQNAATYLAARDDWDFLAVYLDAIDHTCHGFIEYYAPAMKHVGESDAAIYGSVVEGMYRFHDMMLGRLLDVAGPETTVLLVSDHGFYSDHLRPQVPRHMRDPKDKFGQEMNPVAWHRPQGVFVAAGQAIKRDELVYGTTLLDITPTILALFGLPIAEDMDGRVLTTVFANPPTMERVASYEPPHPNDGVHRDLTVEEGDPWAARQAMEQLAALGYIQMPDADNPDKEVAESIRDRRNNLAQVHYAAGRPKLALDLLRELLEERDQPHVRIRMALCLLGMGQPAEAEAILTPTTSSNIDPATDRLIRGQIKLARNELGEAFALLEPLQAEEARLPYIQLVLGQVYLRRGLLTEAEHAFRRALERDDDNAEAHDGLGVALRRLGRLEDAIFEHMRAASLQHHRPQTHLNLGIALAMHRQFDWAISALKIAGELAPLEPLPHRLLAKIYLGAKRDRAQARIHVVEMLRRRAELRRQTHAA